MYIWDNNKVINVISATNSVKQNTRKNLTYEFHFLLNFWFREKDKFIKNDDVTAN